MVLTALFACGQAWVVQKVQFDKNEPSLPGLSTCIGFSVLAFSLLLFTMTLGSGFNPCAAAVKAAVVKAANTAAELPTFPLMFGPDVRPLLETIQKSVLFQLESSKSNHELRSLVFAALHYLLTMEINIEKFS